jgi:predicted AAA+ superfamily ATPase
VDLARAVVSKIKPVAKFREYVRHGYYPFFAEDIETYQQRLEETIYLTLETDLPYTAEISFTSVIKLKKLLYVLAESSPFKPNIAKLSDKTGIPRNSILQFLHYLEDARIINMLHASTRGISYMQKPEKIYLHHPNLHYALNAENTNTGSLRESFFYNQTMNTHKVTYTEKGDFKLDGKFIFEIGGKNKNQKQIAGISDSFVVSDDIETGYKNQIPLWLFGFLY